MNISGLGLCTPAVVIAVLATATVGAFGQLTPVSQSRTADASTSASVPGDSDSDADGDAAAGFGPFIADVGSLATASEGGIVVVAQGVAKQDSSLGVDFVSASGEASADMVLTPGTGGLGEADGASLFELVFTLSGPATYSLVGNVDTSAVVAGGAAIPSLANDVTFYDVDNSLVIFDTLTNDEAFDIAGALAAGTYRLTAGATIDASQATSESIPRYVSGTSSFSFDFQVSGARPFPDGGNLLGMFLLGALPVLSWRRSRA